MQKLAQMKTLCSVKLGMQETGWTMSQLLKGAEEPRMELGPLPTGEPPVPEAVTSRAMIAAGRSSLPVLYYHRKNGVCSIRDLHINLAEARREIRRLQIAATVAELNARTPGHIETNLQRSLTRAARSEGRLERRLTLVA